MPKQNEFSLKSEDELARESARRLVRSTDPDTSRDAANRVAPHLTDLQHRVLQAFWDHGHLTAKELERLPEMEGLGHATARKRCSELKAAGILRDTGERRDGCAVLEVAP